MKQMPRATNGQFARKPAIYSIRRLSDLAPVTDSGSYSYVRSIWRTMRRFVTQGVGIFYKRR